MAIQLYVTINELTGFVMRSVRGSSGIKQKEIVTFLPGITESTYSRKENGKVAIDMDFLFQFCDAVDYSAYKILFTVNACRNSLEAQGVHVEYDGESQVNPNSGTVHANFEMLRHLLRNVVLCDRS